MFVAWERGSCVCCLSPKALLNPGRFIKESGLTVWFSVPSAAHLCDMVLCKDTDCIRIRESLTQEAACHREIPPVRGQSETGVESESVA